MKSFCQVGKILFVSVFVVCEFANVSFVKAQNQAQDAKKVHFYLYPDKTNTNFKQELVLGNSGILRASFFKPHAHTVIYIHGDLDRADNYHSQIMKNAYLATPKFTGNMILMDWGDIAGPLYNLPDSTLNTISLSYSSPLAGNLLGKFLLFLYHEGFLLPNSTHLIGHSLGCQVASLGGMNFVDRESIKIWRITGLEPAPYKIFGLTIKGLDAEDACFVDTIHTTPLTLEYFGHANFFPFKSIDQPGCIEPIICSHYHSVKLYVYSLWMNFPSCQCEPYSDPLTFLSCFKKCPNPVNMGAYVPDTTRGNYVLFPVNPPADPFPFIPNLGWLTPPYLPAPSLG